MSDFDLQRFGNNENGKQTISSLEIANIIGKQHSHVMRDIRVILEQGVSESNFGLGSYTDANGMERPCYNLTIKGCLILASGYRPKLREQIINRLEELEIERKQKNIPSYMIPDEILRAQRWIEERVEERKKLEAANARAEIAEKESEEKSRIIEENQPKVDFADAVIELGDLITISQMAKVLCQNGYNIGRNRFYAWLRNNGYLCKSEEEYNMPTQKFLNMKIFELVEKKFDNKFGEDYFTMVPRITVTGQYHFLHKFKELEIERLRKKNESMGGGLFQEFNPFVPRKRRDK